MDSNNHNNDGAKSQIEKIRIDLEKKLAALEAAKIKSNQRKSLNQEGINTNEVKPIKTNIGNQDSVNDAVDNQRFVEQISNLENIRIPKKIEESIDFSSEVEIELSSAIQKEVVKEKVSNDDTLFEIHDKIESIKEKIANVEKTITEENTVSNTIQTTNNAKPTIVEKEEVEESISLTAIPKTPIISEPITKVNETKVKVKSTIQKTTIPPKKEVIAPINEVFEKSEITKDSEFAEEEEKKSNLNYIIYALAGIIFLVVSYMSWSYFGNSSSNNGNNVLSEYENRRYKDSIELADLSNQLLDFQSQRYIDSIAIANQIQLENSSDKSNFKKTFANNTSNNTNKENKVSSFKEPVQQNTAIISNNEVADNVRFNNNAILGTSISSDNETVIKEELKNEKAEEKTETVKKEEITKPNPEEKIAKKEEPKKEAEPKKKRAETLSTIDKSPIYPGCESQSSELLKKRCLMSKISKFVSRKFNSDLSQDLGLEEGRKKINVSFIIDKFGGVTVLKVRGQHKILEKEALRVVNSLPKMKPGQKNGNAEPVLYNLPIIYKVEY